MLQNIILNQDVTHSKCLYIILTSINKKRGEKMISYEESKKNKTLFESLDLEEIEHN